jgi:hypothetical protein
MRHRYTFSLLIIGLMILNIMDRLAYADQQSIDLTELTLLDQMSVRSAYLDLDSIVTSQERSDWVIDKYALNEMMPKLAEVICQLTPKVSTGLLKLIKDENVKLGGSQEYWVKHNLGDQSEFEEMRHKERVLLSLTHFQTHRSKCPFWLPPNQDFLGIHRDAGRLQLMAETMGGLQLQKNAKDLFLGGAAQGRLIAVYGFTPTWGLGLGFEAGGASTFPKDENGGRSVKPQWTGGVPILVRAWIDNMRMDTELTPVVRFSDDNFSKGQYGVRLALSFGVSPLRVFGVLPHLMAWVGGEQFFDTESTFVLRAGTRIGFSL